MPIQLRDYQKDCLRATMTARSEENITRPLVSLPTGTGKTIVFAELARKLQAKTLILAHRDELIRQAADKVGMVWPGAAIGVIKASENDFREKDVVCASVQTLSREKRLSQIAGEDFNLLVVDEAHHAAARTYREIIDYLGFSDGDPQRLLFGVSATCFRSDKKGLAHIFQKIVYQASILSMVRAGYLSDIRGYRCYSDVDISDVATRKGDFVESQLARKINVSERNQLIVDSCEEYAPGRKAIAFCASVQHAEDLAELFLENGIEARALSCGTSGDERRQALHEFSLGEIRVLTNCSLFTEGFDEPSIDCILMARPTKSPILYTQCIGRGTRKHPGKEDCIVIDFADNRHDICNLPQLLGYDQEKFTNGESLLDEEEEKEISGSGKDNFLPSGKVSIREFDLLGKSAFRWIQSGMEWRLPINPGVYVILSPEPSSGKYQIRLFKKENERVFTQMLHPSALPLGYAQGISEDYARLKGRSFSRKDAPWRSGPASDKQIDLLRRLGINPQGMTKGEACDAIEEFFARQDARRSGTNNYHHAGAW